MSDRAAKIAELQRLQKVDEVRQLHDAEDRSYREADTVMSSVGKAALETAGDVSSAIDKYTGAPVRAAIGAYQNDRPVGEAFANQFLKPAATAPTGKDIAAKAGMSEEEFDTPFIKNPFTREKYKASPAGLAGGVVEAVTDPTTYIGYPEAKMLGLGGKAVEEIAPRLGKTMGQFAEERAVKAATGENRSAIKKMAKVSGKSAGDVNRAMDNLRKTGRTLLNADEAGDPAVGWFSRAKDIGENAEAKRQFYGRKIGEIGDAVEKVTPTPIAGQELAEEMRAYGETIPNVGKGANLKSRLSGEAKNFENLGLKEGEAGPAKPLTFRQTQELKAQFPYEPQAADLLISDKDVNNKIHGIISQKMDQAVEQADKHVVKQKLSKEGIRTHLSDEDGMLYGHATDQDGNVIAKVSGFKDPDGNVVVTQAHTAPEHQKKGIATSLINDMQEQSGGKILFEKDRTAAGDKLAGSYDTKKSPMAQEYADAKQKYGTYKNVADAGAEQGLRTIGRRMVSPSSHGIGAATMVADAAKGDGMLRGSLYGTAAAAVNQQLLSRGSAFAARSADAISRKLLAAPATYQKYLPLFQKAAVGGNAALLATHHQLMNNDPQYRAAMLNQASEESP